MKRIYSVILLVSLLVGTLQPILPMIEFQLHEGSIIELLGTVEGEAQEHCEMLNCNLEDCETQEAEKDRSLLDIDYYPLALEITTIPKPIAFPQKSRFYLPIVKDVVNPAFLPNPPPPRLS